MKIGSDEHKERFCRDFIASHCRFDPATLTWPDLDESALGRLRAIPFWQEVLYTERRAGAIVDAYASRMLTYGATCHFIVPELDAGNQIINQTTYTIPPGMKLDEIIRLGQEDNEPRCLVEGVRRVVAGEVQLHFHRVVARK